MLAISFFVSFLTFPALSWFVYVVKEGIQFSSKMKFKQKLPLRASLPTDSLVLFLGAPLCVNELVCWLPVTSCLLWPRESLRKGTNHINRMENRYYMIYCQLDRGQEKNMAMGPSLQLSSLSHNFPDQIWRKCPIKPGIANLSHFEKIEIIMWYGNSLFSLKRPLFYFSLTHFPSTSEWKFSGSYIVSQKFFVSSIIVSSAHQSLWWRTC